MTRKRYLLAYALALALLIAVVWLSSLLDLSLGVRMLIGFISGSVFAQWARYWNRTYAASHRAPVVWSAAEIKLYNRSMVDRDVQ